MKSTYIGKIVSLRKKEYVSNTGELRSGISGEISFDNSDKIITFDNRGCRERVSQNDIVEFEIGQNTNENYAYNIVVLRKQIEQNVVKHVESNEENPHYLKTYQELYDIGEYEKILRTNDKPDELLKLFLQNPQLVLNSLARYLGDNIENVQLNDFQKNLIHIETLNALSELKNFDWSFKQFTDTTMIRISESEYKTIKLRSSISKSFENIVSRFWIFKNNLSFYLCVLWLISARNSKKQKKKCLSYFPEIASKERDYFVNLYPTWINVCETFIFSTGNTAINKKAFYRKLIGGCLKYKKSDILFKILDLGYQNGYEEATHLKSIFENLHPSYDDLCDIFNKKALGDTSEIYVNVINYLWSENKECSEPFINLLIHLFQKLKESATEFDKIIKGIISIDLYADFNQQDKETILKLYVREDNYNSKNIEELLNYISGYAHENGIESSDIIKNIVQIKNSSIALDIKKEELRAKICEYFALLGDTFCQKDYEIFAHLSFSVIEDLLLEKYKCNDYKDTQTTFALLHLYFSQKEWIKAAYIYTVSKKQRIKNFLFNFNGISDHFEKSFSIYNIDNLNNYDVIKIALRVMSCEEFDIFIEWAKRITANQSQYDKDSTRQKLFERELGEMLSGDFKENGLSYDECWQFLLKNVFKEKHEVQDSLRFSIVASFFARYGEKKYIENINELIDELDSKKEQHDYYSVLWKSLTLGQYSSNFLSLNMELIENAPLTYWNLFFDYAVCKNHVFSLTSFWGEQWHNPDCNMQEFYDLLLKRYIQDRESVFLKIAANLLENCEDVVNPNFDQYLTYCQSIKDKDFIFRMIIRLMNKNNHIDYLKFFLNSGVWNCNEQENTLLQTLLSLVNEKEQDLASYVYLPEDKYVSFKKDLLNVFKNYPDISNIYDDLGEIDPSTYYYTLFNAVFEVCFDNDIFKRVMANGLALPDNLSYETVDEILASYLEMIITIYKKQLQNPIERGDNQYSIYVQNRYHRIFASKLLLGKESNEDIENSIYELISSNGHEKRIKANFNNFKDLLADFLNHVGEKSILSKWILKGIVTNNWTEFCNNIDQYPEKALCKLSEILKHTRYQELNKALLLLFISKKDSVYEFKNNIELQKKVNCCSCLVGNILGGLTENDNSKIEHIANICQLETLFEARAGKSVRIFNELLNIIENYSTDTKQKDLDIKLYTSALRSTVYDQTIVFFFRKILLTKGKKASRLWENVFSIMNCLDLYYYNLAVIKAENQKRDDAKKDLELFKNWQIVYKMQKNGNVMFSEEWKSELLLLESYINGDSNSFVPLHETEINLVFSEKNSEGIDLLKKHVRYVQRIELNSVLASLKVFADKSIPLSEKLDDCMILLTYVTGPDSFYELMKKSKHSIESISYNEFLIISAAILIISSKNCSGSDKLDIIFTMLDVFENLQEKDRIKDYNDKIKKDAVAYLFAPNSLPFDAWIGNYGKGSEKDIEKILSSCSEKSNVLPLTQLIKSCQQSLKNCSSEMQKLNCLKKWKQANRIPQEASDYEKSFEVAVETKIEELSLLPMIKLTVSSDMIEDGKIYYLLENLDTSKACIFLDNEKTQVQATITLKDKKVSYQGVFNNPIGILRPGYSCGQYFELPSTVLENIENYKFEVIINIIVDGATICNNKDDQGGICEFQIVNTNCSLISVNVKNYRYDSPAFSDEIKGIGREKEKEKIKQILLDKNLLILYGPSRVGKSSLLNYIRNELIVNLAKDDRPIMHISVANQFNEDYQKNMIDASDLDSFTSHEQILDYLFISPLKIAFTDSENSRCKKIGQKDLSESTQKSIKDILYGNGAVLEKIQKVAKQLSAEKCQLWLIFDEFQQAIAKWTDISNELEALCGTIATYTDGIKLILCGSDELVRLFECDDMAQWKNFRATISNEYTYLVEQLNESDFCDMMKDSYVWGNTSAFSDDALKLLHKYTGGNAISGKIFGNEILKELSTDVYSNRNRIYPSDITRVAYKLLAENKNGSLKTLLTDNTTKNLDDDAQNYLIYIAYMLHKEPGRLSVSFKEIKNFFKNKTANEIESSVKLLCARGLIKTQGEMEYKFSTMFYFDFFNLKAHEDKINELREIYTSEENDSLEHIQDRVVGFCNASDPSKATGLLTGIIGQLKDKSIEESIRTTLGGTQNNYTHIEGDVIQNNIQINAQTINTAFTTLLTPNIDSRSFLAAFESLPKLTSYLEETQKAQVKQISENLLKDYDEYGNCFDIDGNCINYVRRTEIQNRIVEQETELEKLNSPAEKKLVSDTVGAIVNSDDFMTLSEYRWQELLGLKDKSIVAKLKSLPSEFEAPLTFAVVLHNVFDNLHRTIERQKNSQMKFTQELDYCPVAIMYCKIVEAMLKKGHTPLYIRNLGEKTLKIGSTTTFADLGTPEDFDTKNKDLSIGSYTSHLVYLPKWKISLNPQLKPTKNDFWFKKVVEGETVNYTDNIYKLIADEDIEDDLLPLWKSHARALEIIRVIRNRSAHDAMNITKENIDWLIDILFKQGELLRIWDLSEK